MPAKRPRRHLLSLADFADLVGKHRTTVQQWIRDGMPVTKARGGKQGAHVIEVRPAIEWLLSREAEAFEAKLKELTSSPDIEAAKARKAAADADLAEMARDLKRAELVVTADVEERWASMMVGLREAVMGVPGTAVQDGIIGAQQEAALARVCRDSLVAAAKYASPRA